MKQILILILGLQPKRQLAEGIEDKRDFAADRSSLFNDSFNMEVKNYLLEMSELMKDETVPELTIIKQRIVLIATKSRIESMVKPLLGIGEV